MKAILMSDRPKWVAMTLNGKKIIEIRKTMPKCELPIEVYIYCTNGGLPLEYIEGHGFSLSIYNPQSYKPKDLRGKVVAKFTLRKVEKFSMANPYEEPTRGLLDKACLTIGEARTYAGGEHPRYKPLYAWHISDLVIFDEPKELSEFHSSGKFDKVYRDLKNRLHQSDMTAYMTAEAESVLKRPPQSWQYVEVKE